MTIAADTTAMYVLRRNQERKVRSFAQWSRASEDSLGKRRGVKRGWERKGWVLWVLWVLEDVNMGYVEGLTGLGKRMEGIIRIDVHGAGAERVDDPRAEARGFGHCAKSVFLRDNLGGRR